MNWDAIKMLISLALLPEELIKEGYDIIKNIFDGEQCAHLGKLFQYYKKTWIDGFKPKSFCVFRKMHRTNNISERHNRELKEALKKHSTIVEFLGIL